jgi:diguanylate cyclase (GGDEF)-like protein
MTCAARLRYQYSTAGVRAHYQSLEAQHQNLNLMQSTLNITLLEQLIDALQACYSRQEAYATIQPLVQQLFPEDVGAIFVMNSSKNLLEAIASWGPTPLTSDLIFTPDECIALRRGQAHAVEDTHCGLICQHIRSHSLPVETFCVPMVAHGETLGVLYVGSLNRGKIAQTKQLATKVAKHISLALANLELRETLNNQSFRDPLTNLYNRHYLEESLEREIRRSERHPQSLGIILLAIDRFKNFNESFGYEAGELLLREVGAFLPSRIRASDIACRYGGEEFLLLLPEASLKVIQQRAEQLRQSIKNLSIRYKRQTLNSITISCGVASFSVQSLSGKEHSLTGKAMIQVVHEALDIAKDQGGDRTVVHPTEMLKNSLDIGLNKAELTDVG